MDISYGEGGAQAFIRLQEQLMQGGSHTDDMTVFDWTFDAQESVPRRSIFATSPKAFEEHDHSIFIRMHSNIIEKCKTLMGVRADEDEGSDDEEEEEEEEDGIPASESDEGAMSSILIAENGVHMSVWLLELKTLCEMVGDASYEIDRWTWREGGIQREDVRVRRTGLTTRRLILPLRSEVRED